MQILKFLEEAEIFLSEKEAQLLIKVLDKNRNGVVDYTDFLSYI